MIFPSRSLSSAARLAGVSKAPPAGTIGVSVLATMLLIVAVVHQDASASLRDDWLTRPIPRWTMVTAKLVFIAAVVCVPAMAVCS